MAGTPSSSRTISDSAQITDAALGSGSASSATMLGGDRAWRAPSAVAIRGARVRSTAARSIANNAETAVAFDAEVFDSDAFHDTAVNNTRLTVPAGLDGKYLVGGNFRFAAHISAVSYIGVKLNGATLVAAQTDDMKTDSVNKLLAVATLLDLVATDFVELIAFQLSGAAVDVDAVNTSSPGFWLTRIAT